MTLRGEYAGTGEHRGSASLGRIALEQVPAPAEEQAGPSRRDFLKLAGFAFAGTALAGCQRAPVQYAVPYLISPEGIIPGRSYDYASTCRGCSAGCGLLVRNRDGRPIKLEGNPQHPLSRGGLCAAGQASLLGLYDQERLQHPLIRGKKAEWPEVDQAIAKQLDDVRKQKGTVRFLTGPGVSPTMRALLQQFLQTFPASAGLPADRAISGHVVHDPRPSSAILEAHVRSHGLRVFPRYHLEIAEVIVSFDADFLGTWISPVEFTAAYQAGRRLEGPSPRLSYHVQFESLLSLTGSKADRRLCLAPTEIGAAMGQLAARLAKKAGIRFDEGSLAELPAVSGFLDHLADYLWQKQNRRKSLILCGSQDVEHQVLCNFLNHVLENYGTTVDVARPSYQREGNDRELQTLVQELHEGKIGALFIYQSNPVHDLPSGESIAEDLTKRVPLVVSLAPRLDETARLAHFVCPDHHYLESWNDSEPVNGLVSLVQPAIAPLGNTRSVLESLAAWTGKQRGAYDLVREHWEQRFLTAPVLGATTVALMGSPLGQGPLIASSALLSGRTAVVPGQGQNGSFQDFWDHTLHNGFAEVEPRPTKVGAFKPDAIRLGSRANSPPDGTYSLVLYAKVGMPDAGHAYNAWLQELPDPISKVTWDNYACLSPATAARLNVTDGDVVRLETTAGSGPAVVLELPAFVQPGMHDQAVAVALGYGSVLSKRFADVGPSWLQAKPTVGPDGMVGKNAASLLSWVERNLRLTRDGIRLTKTGAQYPLATTQGYYEITVPKHLALEGQERPPVIRDTTLADLRQVKANGKKAAVAVQGKHAPAGSEEDLWPADHPVTGPRWGMAIDLTACTGCSACVIACQAENNTPVVGKDEVRRHREMHWLRIDRYYTARDGGVDVAHQPMLCQHCGNAPCEVVCPVLATVHSSEGLNVQVYNRCVGTRYCANNCPYKVRRFNWFDYAHDDLLQNLVLNPDVTVRSRGVMEKCTFCVQRIEEAKIEAARLGHPLRDGDLQTACQQSCPARAISFGNLNDHTSRVAQLAADRRSYRVLGELNIKPSISYLSLVRNRPEEMEGKRNG
jgi:molybdopterin-containing oxidoreductase family iron-sulfur binding subunit